METREETLKQFVEAAPKEWRVSSAHGGIYVGRGGVVCHHSGGEIANAQFVAWGKKTLRSMGWVVTTVGEPSGGRCITRIKKPMEWQDAGCFLTDTEWEGVALCLMRAVEKDREEKHGT